METPTASALDTLANQLSRAVSDLDAAHDLAGVEDRRLLGGFAGALVEIRGQAQALLARAEAAEERSAA